MRPVLAIRAGSGNPQGLARDARSGAIVVCCQSIVHSWVAGERCGRFRFLSWRWCFRQPPRCRSALRPEPIWFPAAGCSRRVSHKLRSPRQCRRRMNRPRFSQRRQDRPPLNPYWWRHHRRRPNRPRFSHCRRPRSRGRRCSTGRRRFALRRRPTARCSSERDLSELLDDGSHQLTDAFLVPLVKRPLLDPFGAHGADPDEQLHMLGDSRLAHA